MREGGGGEGGGGVSAEGEERSRGRRWRAGRRHPQLSLLLLSLCSALVRCLEVFGRCQRTKRRREGLPLPILPSPALRS